MLRDYERLARIADRVETSEATCIRWAAETLRRLAELKADDGWNELIDIMREARREAPDA